VAYPPAGLPVSKLFYLCFLESQDRMKDGGSMYHLAHPSVCVLVGMHSENKGQPSAWNSTNGGIKKLLLPIFAGLQLCDVWGALPSLVYCQDT
jgi:hypothetical protein